MPSSLVDADRRPREVAASATAARSTRPRLLARSSCAYVVAWVLGLSLHPAGVTTGDRAEAVADHYAEHRGAAIVQVLLVHAVAAAALLAFGLGLARVAKSSRRTSVARWVRAVAALAGATSLVQAVVGVSMIVSAGSVAASHTRGLLIAVERLDAVKLVGLAGLCAAGVVLSSARALVRWTGALASAATVCLLLAAVGLAGIVPTLTAAAAPALVLLLAWVAAVPFIVRRSVR